MNKVRSYLLLLAALAMVMPVSARTIRADPDNQSMKTGPISRALNHVDFKSRLKHRLVNLSDDRIEKFLSSTDSSLVLFVGWHRVTRELKNGDSNSRDEAGARALARFLGLVEGRIAMALPKSWEKRLLTARFDDHNRIEMEDCAAEEVETLRQAISRQEYQPWTVTVGDRKIKVLDDQQGTRALVATAEDADTSYISVYSVFEKESSVVAIDRNTGEKKWQSRLFLGANSKKCDEGHWKLLELRVNDASVVAFGMEDTGQYFDAFDKATGKATCRFSTEFVYP